MMASKDMLLHAIPVGTNLKTGSERPAFSLAKPVYEWPGRYRSILNCALVRQLAEHEHVTIGILDFEFPVAIALFLQGPDHTHLLAH